VVSQSSSADSGLIHATAIANGRHCALLRGPSGIGKSDLALRCLATPPIEGLTTAPLQLVADDQVELKRATAEGRVKLIAAPPLALTGLIEIRGIGIARVAHVAPVEVGLVIDLVASGETASIARMPPDPLATETLLGTEVPRIELDPREASAPMKVAAALATLCGERDPPG